MLWRAKVTVLVIVWLIFGYFCVLIVFPLFQSTKTNPKHRQLLKKNFQFQSLNFNDESNIDNKFGLPRNNLKQKKILLLSEGRGGSTLLQNIIHTIFFDDSMIFFESDHPSFFADITKLPQAIASYNTTYLQLDVNISSFEFNDIRIFLLNDLLDCNLQNINSE